MKKITKTEYVLNEKEARLVKDCLDYVLHRKRKHCKPRNINETAVEELIKFIKWALCLNNQRTVNKSSHRQT